MDIEIMASGKNSISTELTCPECGGIIGASEESSGRACRCLANNPAAGISNGEPSSGDTVVESSIPATKVCCQCGKDLTGKKRLRDSRGYWCVDCHKADKAANAPKGEKCDDCGRIVAPTALSEFEGRRICGICRNDQAEAAREKRRLSPVKTDAYQKLDRRRLIVMFGVFIVLLIIIILRQLHLIGT
jgi:hypothetical protein